MNDIYSIGEACASLDINQHVLRYIEKTLSLDVKRDSNNNRYYTNEDLIKLKKIKELKDQGYTYKAIAEAIGTEVTPEEQSIKITDTLTLDNTNLDAIQITIKEIITPILDDVVSFRNKEILEKLDVLEEAQNDLINVNKQIQKNTEEMLKEKHFKEIDLKLQEIRENLEKKKKKPLSKKFKDIFSFLKH